MNPSDHEKTILMKYLVAKSNIGIAYRDLAAMERAFADSGLDWCCPRPTRLTRGPLTRRVKGVESFPMTAGISRADVACGCWSTRRSRFASARR